MQLLEGLVGLVGLVLYILLLFLLTAGLWFALTAAVGLVGSVLSVPLLYVLPDVRGFLIRASGGRPDSAPWRVAVRPRYLLGAAAFGIVYGLVFVPLMQLLGDIGLFPGRGEPTPILLVIPLTVGAASALLAFAVHRYAAPWDEGTTSRGVFAQWLAFLTVVTGVGTGVAVLAIT